MDSAPHTHTLRSLRWVNVVFLSCASVSAHTIVTSCVCEQDEEVSSSSHQTNGTTLSAVAGPSGLGSGSRKKSSKVQPSFIIGRRDGVLLLWMRKWRLLSFCFCFYNRDAWTSLTSKTRSHWIRWCALWHTVLFTKDKLNLLRHLWFSLWLSRLSCCRHDKTKRQAFARNRFVSDSSENSGELASHRK